MVREEVRRTLQVACLKNEKKILVVEHITG